MQYNISASIGKGSENDLANEKMNSISVRISDDEKDLLSQYASSQDLTISQVVRRAIKEFLQTNLQTKGDLEDV